MIFRNRDDLLHEPLLSPDELKSYVTDLKDMQQGKSNSFVGTQFWERVIAEMARRQANAQISAANSLKHATWWLALLTLLLVIVTALPLALRTCVR